MSAVARPQAGMVPHARRRPSRRRPVRMAASRVPIPSPPPDRPIVISPENKKLAQYLLGVMGKRPSIRTHRRDENPDESVDIVSAADVPTAGVTTHASIRLSDFDTGLRIEGIPLGVELLTAADSSVEFAPNVIATCAFNIMNAGGACKPGNVHHRVVELYYPRSHLKHIYLAAPILWPIETQHLGSKVAAWLMALPISDAELRLFEDQGEQALEDRFEAAQIDVYDWNRPSVV
jgi:hypothetical protein